MADALDYDGKPVRVAFGKDTLLIIAEGPGAIHLWPHEARRLAKRLTEVADLLPLRDEE